MNHSMQHEQYVRSNFVHIFACHYDSIVSLNEPSYGSVRVGGKGREKWTQKFRHIFILARLEEDHPNTAAMSLLTLTTVGEK